MSPAKTAEQIEMSFGWMTRMGPRNHVLDWVQIPKGKGQLVLFNTLKGIVSHCCSVCRKKSITGSL